MHAPGRGRGRCRAPARWSPRRRAGSRAPNRPSARDGRPAPAGASCIWSPSSTRLRADVPAATRLASATCPASSTNRKSSCSVAVLVGEQPGGAGDELRVEPPDVAVARHVCTSPGPSDSVSGRRAVGLLHGPDSTAASPRRFITPASRWSIALWLFDVMPTPAGSRSRCDDHARAGVASCPRRAGPARTGARVERRAAARQPSRSIGTRRDDRLPRGRPADAAAPRRSSRSHRGDSGRRRRARCRRSGTAPRPARPQPIGARARG